MLNHLVVERVVSFFSMGQKWSFIAFMRQILQTFQETDKATVNNPIGFLAGILKRFARSAKCWDLDILFE